VTQQAPTAETDRKTPQQQGFSGSKHMTAVDIKCTAATAGTQKLFLVGSLVIPA